jgi:probable rRNA maturation factor
MIDFNYELDYELEHEEDYKTWLSSIIFSHQKSLGDISFIFCNDEYLHRINLEYLKHDTLTDIISFDYSDGSIISGDIFISIERVKENATTYNVSFKTELLRVLSHGILHFLGFKDKTKEDVLQMRSKEEESIALFHVKHEL